MRERLEEQYDFDQETISQYQAFFEFFKKELQPLVERWDYLKNGNSRQDS